MLYEPYKRLKKIIIIGAAAIVLAVLAIVVIPLFFKDKTLQTPVANLSPKEKFQQQKIQKEQNGLIETSKNQSNPVPSAEQLQNDSNRLIEEAKANGTGKSPEDIQKDQNNLIKATKK